METLENVHPGDVLYEDYMKPLGLSRNALARELRVPPNRISKIVNGERSITADTALRLSRYFGTTPEFWLGLQADYDLEETEKEIAEDIERIEQHFGEEETSDEEQNNDERERPTPSSASGDEREEVSRDCLRVTYEGYDQMEERRMQKILRERALGGEIGEAPDDYSYALTG